MGKTINKPSMRRAYTKAKDQLARFSPGVIFKARLGSRAKESTDKGSECCSVCSWACGWICGWICEVWGLVLKERLYENDLKEGMKEVKGDFFGIGLFWVPLSCWAHLHRNSNIEHPTKHAGVNKSPLELATAWNHWQAHALCYCLWFCENLNI